MSHWLAFVVALAVTALTAPLVRFGLARVNMIDVPTSRSSHTAPVLRGGGIAVAAGAIVATAGQWSSQAFVAVAVSSALLGAVGLADDRLGLSAKTRLVAQLAIPAGIMPLLLDGMSATRWWTWCFAALCVLWCAAFTNAFNFMDGVNGMAVAQTAVAGVGLAVVGNHIGLTALAVAGLAIAGAAAAFGPFNLPVAIMFLGDVGSYFIGAWLAVLALIAVRNSVPPEVIVAPFLVYLLDTSTTLIRRARRGEHLFQAHREHAYQRLVQLGWSHAKTALIAGISMAASTAVMLLFIDAGPVARGIAFVAALGFAVAFVALPNSRVSSKIAPS